MIPVRREESEVFSPATMASFEGMPVTDDHPDDPDGVTAENAGRLQRGHAQDVRRGTGENADLLLADLIITDPVLIGNILAGKREISCGYNYELEERNGVYTQRRIRGNHIAVVDAGRAGRRVAIRDRRPEKERSKQAMTSRPNWMHKFLARYAKDAPEDDVAEVLAEILEETAAPEAGQTADEDAPEAETPRETENAAGQKQEADACGGCGEKNGEDDETAAEGLTEKLDRVLALLEALLAARAGADEDSGNGETQEDEDPEEAPEDDADWLFDEPGEEAPEAEPDPAELIEARDRAIRAALRAVKPALDALDGKTRRAVTEQIRHNVYAGDAGNTGANSYAKLKRAADRARPDDGELGRRIMRKYNCNMQKED